MKKFLNNISLFFKKNKFIVIFIIFSIIFLCYYKTRNIEGMRDSPPEQRGRSIDPSSKVNREKVRRFLEQVSYINKKMNSATEPVSKGEHQYMVSILEAIEKIKAAHPQIGALNCSLSQIEVNPRRRPKPSWD